jgi:hypothetical protein
MIAVSLALSMSSTVAQATDFSWDGTWIGTFHEKANVAVVIAKDKVVNFSLMGTPFPIQYSKLSPSSVSLGDRDHYNLTLTKAVGMTASATYHGVHGYSNAILTKQLTTSEADRRLPTRP